MTEACAICQTRPAHGRTRWCGGCFARLHTELAELAYAHWWLGRAIETPPSAWKPGTIGHGGGSRPPLRVDLVDVRVQIEQHLVGWSKMIARYHVPAMAGPADSTPEIVVKWLVARLPWASEQEWCDALAVDTAGLRNVAHAACPWERGRRDLPTKCPQCGLLTLSLHGGDEWAVCRNRECGRLVPPGEYQQLVTKQVADYRAAQTEAEAA